MADEVKLQTLENGPKNLIIRATSLSDGTGETAVTKLDATSATFANKGVAPGIYIKLRRIQYDIRNGGLRIQWDATTDEDLLVLDENGDLKFDPPMGVPSGLAGATGSINFTTVGFMLNSGYSVVMAFTKGVPQL